MEAGRRRRVRRCTPETAEGREKAALLEQELRQRGLCCVEEARLLERYLALSGYSQEECARRLGRSQSSVANRLRLLRLPEEVLEALEAGRLTERHGRALLRLQDEAAQRQALGEILRRSLSVAETENYMESLLSVPERCAHTALSAEGVFLNTLSLALDALHREGVECGIARRETEEALILTVTVRKSGRA